ncbi:uncharacterized protein TNIN_429301 [Trichonephila inaurata madagascariensis]|uniref:Uncharacterized protein n=1 Tax=Trichonephila inaurata madagascariensis TaxID=2747483 RepID=A0A8X6MD28_9ARAC|nr:uncharacterized protein TNIN_429301 [Trichonephila inaurata madagascariensis]
MDSKSSTFKARSYKLQKKCCLLGMCHDAPKWKAYGVMSKDVVQYSNLLGQKRKFQQLMKMNESQISCRKNSCCVIDKNYSLKGSNIDILIFDESEHHNALYLEYFVDKQTILKNCNKLLSFLNFKKNSVFHIQNSFIYVKSADGLKWEFFYDLLEFLLKKHNKSVLGSQFYFPLTCKCLIRNEMRLLYLLQNMSESLEMKNVSVNISGQSEKTFVSDLCQKGLPTKKSHIMSTILNVKKKSAFFTAEINNRKKSTNNDKYASQEFNLKRKSVASDENKRKLIRLSSECFENSSCRCQSKSKHVWKMFKPFNKNPIANYSDILNTKNWFDDSSTARVISFNSSFDANKTQHSNSRVSLSKDSSTICNINKKESLPLLDRIPNVEKIGGIYFSEVAEQSKFKRTSDLRTLKEIVPTFRSVESTQITNPQHYQICSANTKSFPKNLESRITKNVTEEKESIAGPSKETLPLGFASFHTAHGKALKISEKALKVAEKLFEEVCAEELDVSDIKEFKIVSKNDQKRKEFAVKKEYVDEDINSILAENFFEDIPFDEREIECKPVHTSMKSPLRKSDTFKTTQNQKTRKSLGGRRCLKPFTFNK